MANPTVSESTASMKKTSCLTTEVFKSSFAAPVFKEQRDLLRFITEHKMFRTPHKLTKIFHKVGLANFKEPCELAKPLLDLKKDNFVTPLINTMMNGLVAGRDEAINFADRIQFLLDGEERDNQLAKTDDIYNLSILIRNLVPQLDTYNNAYERVVQTSEGKIVLRLHTDVVDRNGKAVFRKNESLFKVFSKLREQFIANNLTFMQLDQTLEFKHFCAENVPNKTYQVVFSSDGEEGAWDLLTMSMRGIRSCQRWSGEYPRCLIGTILSKFVGIIYITSGAQTEYSNDEKGQLATVPGIKMMRRALVRYVIDADAGSPCLIIDRMYPLQQGQDVDEESLRVFLKALTSKTSLPIYYAPHLGTKVKHFYVPYENIRNEIPERDWTYQDTPLKTDLDFKLHLLSLSSNEDVMRYINCFKNKLIAQMGEHYRRILNNSIRVDNEIARTINNLRLNSPIDKFNEQIVHAIFAGAPFQTPANVTDPQDGYRKYLMKLAIKLKDIRAARQSDINAHIDGAITRHVDHEKFTDYLFNHVVLDCIKQELKSVI